ncbi:hypothetical protein ACFQH5_20215 [Halomonas salifodinae]|uniref:Head fiber protein n=1 Tax=Halomonas salifodinae TaxID=438745 RepID=A0ABW2F4C7_9GAMM
MARLFGKQDNLTVTDKLRLGKDSKMKLGNADGSESEVTVAEIKKLAGTGATIASGTTQAKITDASTAHALNATFSDTEVEAALDALGTKINTLIDALEAFKVSSTS